MHVMDHLPRIGRTGTEKNEIFHIKGTEVERLRNTRGPPRLYTIRISTDKGILHYMEV